MKICIFGSEGRMGRAVAAEAGDSVVAKYDVTPPGTPPDVPLSGEVDVVIDFSIPSAWKDLDILLKGTGAALVTGTTGLEKEHMDLMEKWAVERPVFHSLNMSRGIHVLGKLLEVAAGMLGKDFSLEIVEIHHGGKVDSPSGTALELASAWEGVMGPSRRIMGRHGAAGPRRKDELGFHSLRGGDVPGEHQLHLLGDGERLVLTHAATGRRTFALGALKAAGFVAGKPPGLYSMEDMMNREFE